MPKRSPKRTDTSPKSRKTEDDVKTDSDYRLIIVLGGALVLAILIIVGIMWISR
jgi:hypothetical protein